VAVEASEQLLHETLRSALPRRDTDAPLRLSPPD